MSTLRRSKESYNKTTMLLGVPLSEIALARARHRRRWRHYRILAGLFGIGGGAVSCRCSTKCSRARRAGSGAHATLRRHLDRDHFADHGALFSHTPRKGLVIPRVIRLWAIPAVIGVTCGSVIAAFAPPAVFKIAFVLIAGFIATKFLFAGDRWNLGTDLPGTVPMTLLRLWHRACRIADGGERRLAVQHRADTLRQADPTMRSRPRRGLACRSPSSVRLGYILAGLPIMRLLRRSRSASSR